MKYISLSIYMAMAVSKLSDSPQRHFYSRIYLMSQSYLTGAMKIWRWIVKQLYQFGTFFSYEGHRLRNITLKDHQGQLSYQFLMRRATSDKEIFIYLSGPMFYLTSKSLQPLQASQMTKTSKQSTLSLLSCKSLKINRL